MKNKIKSGDSMLAILFSLTGNARACVCTEPLWSIPFFLFNPYFTLYMYNLGVKDAEIGVLLSAGFMLQLVFAFVSGALSDKFGRRKTTFVADFVSWSIPCLIWAFAQDIKWFAAAAILNSILQVSVNSWQCLLVEDTDDKLIVSIYNWIYICGQLVVFFAPVSGLLIARHGLIPVMRGLFIFSTVLMTFKFVLFYILSVETTHGKKRIEETKNESIPRLLFGYKDVFLRVIKDRAAVRVCFILTLSWAASMTAGNFFSLYATQNLGLAEMYISWFPIVRAAVMLFLFFAAQKWLSKKSMRSVMLAALFIFAAGHALLISVPALAISALSLLMIFTAVDAVAFALFMPRRDAMLLLDVEPEERARILAIIFVVSLGAMSPFGTIAGFISSIDRRLPFAMNLVLFAAMAVIVATMKRNDQTAEAAD